MAYLYYPANSNRNQGSTDADRQRLTSDSEAGLFEKWNSGDWTKRLVA